MRTFLWAYLRQRRRSLLAAGIVYLVFAVTFALYHLPLEAVMYPALICLAIGGLYAVLDGRKCWQRHEQLQHLTNAIAVSADRLPASDRIEVRDYQEMVRRLLREQAEREADLSQRYTNRIDYYTLWAHQIKTPIASMKLQLQCIDDSRSRHLSSELNRIEQYVEMALAYLRLDSDTTDYVFRQVDLDALIRSSIRRFSGDFITRRLSVNYQPIHYRLITDEKWLGFVIEQVLSNALKYTLEGGVCIYLEEPGTLCIRDTGIGIAPEDLPRVFQNGYTGLNGRSDRKASGLGLHLCKRICEELGHAITIESEPDKGTCVRIDLYKPEARFE